MRQKIFIFFIIFFAAILEVSFFPNLFWSRAAPQIVLLLIVVWSARKKISLMRVVVAGIILDLLIFERIGFNVAFFLFISHLIGFLAKRFFVMQKTRAFFSIAFFVLIATVAYDIYASLFFGLIGRSSFLETLSFAQIFNWRDMFLGMVSNLAVFAIIYWPITKMKSIFAIEEVKLTLR